MEELEGLVNITCSLHLKMIVKAPNYTLCLPATAAVLQESDYALLAY